MALLLLAHAALAMPVVVRLDPAGSPMDAPVVVLGAGGQTVEVPLRDDGETPDLAAGDGRWAGAGEADGTELTLEVRSGDAVLGSTQVRFEDPDAPRDVDLVWKDGALGARVSVPPNAAGRQASAPPGGETEGPPPPGAGVGRGADTGFLYVAFGVGLLALLGAAWGWSRWRGRMGLPFGVTRLPEPGLLGPGTPSLADGLSAWVVPPDSPFGDALLAHLARHHRVLVVARSERVVAGVAGGPVYRLGAPRPARVGDVAEALARRPGPPLVVLLLLDTADPAQVAAFRDLLPAEVSGVALVPVDGEVGVPRVVVEPAADGSWWLRTTTVTRRVWREGDALRGE